MRAYEKKNYRFDTPNEKRFKTDYIDGICEPK